MVPQKVFSPKESGRHKDYLQSFELALRDAGIETQNLVTVSSIFPPGCKRISKEEGVKYESGFNKILRYEPERHQRAQQTYRRIRRFGYPKRQPTTRLS